MHVGVILPIDYLNYTTGIGIMKYCILCGVATTSDLRINHHNVTSCVLYS